MTSELPFDTATDERRPAPPASASTTERPNCPVCGEPALWRSRSRRWSAYCGGNSCTNPTRLCKQCGKTYLRDLGGTRFCSPQCRDIWHGAAHKAKVILGVCSNCDEPRHGHNLWDLCAQCYARVEPVAQRLRKHHVPIAIVSRLLADQTCFNPACDNNILETYRDPYTGRATTRLVVDHDHRHCPGAYSCGICVRGLMCTNCNTAFGMLGEDRARILGLADYLASIQ